MCLQVADRRRILVDSIIFGMFGFGVGEIIPFIFRIHWII